jgi:lysyl-tRNA synthetase class 2
VELDGSQHSQNGHMRLDARRTAFLERMGYRVIRFENDLVLRNTDAVLDEIARVLEVLTIHGD